MSKPGNATSAKQSGRGECSEAHDAAIDATFCEQPSTSSGTRGSVSDSDTPHKRAEVLPPLRNETDTILLASGREKRKGSSFPDRRTRQPDTHRHAFLHTKGTGEIE
ncbi:hypothetical protein MTO96_003674 [Rhipicephalus appendiculatus]